MKQILFVALAVFLFFAYTSCTSGNKSDVVSKNTVGEQKNLAAFETVSKAFETGDVSGIDGAVADDLY